MNWPVIGLQYFIQGKLEWYLQHADEAYSYLQKAVLVLRVSHPNQCSLMHDLYSLLHAVEAELGFRSHPQLTDVSA